MSSMFDNCKSLQELDVSEFDTSNVVDMSFLFQGCENLKEIIVPIGHKQRIADLFEEKDAMYKQLLVEK